MVLIKQTTPGYARLNQFNILQGIFLHPVKHSYYEEYSALQQICIQILSEEKSGFGSDKKSNTWNHYRCVLAMGRIHWESHWVGNIMAEIKG